MRDKLISANALIEHLERCIAESKGLFSSLCVAIKCYVDQMPAVDMPQWIPVTERLPDKYGTFLVAIDEVHGENRISVDAADFDPFEKKWSTFGYFCAGYKVTHWMPLPEPPKEVE